MVPELIHVRPDERFDQERLHAYLRGRLPGADGVLRVRQFAGGHANLTYLLHFESDDGTAEYVLRRPPLGPVAPGAHDMEREHHVLSRLWAGFPLAPRSYHHCEDTTIIGAPFFVMERRRGLVVRNTVPEEFGGGTDPIANRKLSEVVIDTLAAFHAVDAGAVGLGDLGRPDGFLERQVHGWRRRWEASRIESRREAEAVADWLLDRLPRSPAPTLLHNDWRLDNMAVSPDDPGVCVAVYDWDMCTRGDPLADLGTLLSVWYDRGEEATALNPMPVDVPGFMTRVEAIARYGSRSGRDVSTMPWYVVFGTFKMAVIIQQIYFRWHEGQTADERFAGMDETAGRLFRLAAARVPS
jgi:aminoglycoside phosphotransferase (APT) family kinase protein